MLSMLSTISQLSFVPYLPHMAIAMSFIALAVKFANDMKGE